MLLTFRISGHYARNIWTRATKEHVRLSKCISMYIGIVRPHHCSEGAADVGLFVWLVVQGQDASVSDFWQAPGSDRCRSAGQKDVVKRRTNRRTRRVIEAFTILRRSPYCINTVSFQLSNKEIAQLWLNRPCSFPHVHSKSGWGVHHTYNLLVCVWASAHSLFAATLLVCLFVFVYL